MKKEEFNINAAATKDSGIFGLPFTSEECEIIIIPVPWEVTVSYGSGTINGPAAIKDASYQVDLCQHDFPDLWEKGIYMDTIPEEIIALNDQIRHEANTIITALENNEDTESSPALKVSYNVVNQGCMVMNQWVKDRSSYWKSKGKKVGLIGGDHSTPLGYLQLQGDNHDDFGLLVIDAHMDLRNAYEGFTYSHASIFFNALKEIPQISKLVEVGIRDYCHEEKEFVLANDNRISVHFDREVRRLQYKGKTWDEICRGIINELPDKVYVSVDIDGLDSKLCPNTGTPVPGGLQYEELIHLLNVLKESNKTIIGFDLCEVSPGEDDWDGNVGARLLFHLCGIV